MSLRYRLFFFLFAAMVGMLFVAGVSIGCILTKIKYTGFVSVNEILSVMDVTALSVVFALLTGLFVCYYAKNYIRLIKFNKENGYGLPNFVLKDEEKIAENLIKAEKPKQGNPFLQKEKEPEGEVKKSLSENETDGKTEKNAAGKNDDLKK